jgi:hypothetical protein
MATKVRRWQSTGEVREPRSGEYYLSRSIEAWGDSGVCAVMRCVWNDLGCGGPRVIMEPVGEQVDSPQCAEGPHWRGQEPFVVLKLPEGWAWEEP